MAALDERPREVDAKERRPTVPRKPGIQREKTPVDDPRKGSPSFIEARSKILIMCFVAVAAASLCVYALVGPWKSPIAPSTPSTMMVPRAPL